jgi:hypothetical protein
VRGQLVYTVIQLHQFHLCGPGDCNNALYRFSHPLINKAFIQNHNQITRQQLEGGTVRNSEESQKLTDAPAGSFGPDDAQNLSLVNVVTVKSFPIYIRLQVLH